MSSEESRVFPWWLTACWKNGKQWEQCGFGTSLYHSLKNRLWVLTGPINKSLHSYWNLNRKLKVLYVRERSAIKGAYLSSLKAWLRSIFASHGQVNSNNMTSREVSLTMKISGLRLVTRTWGGMVPPPGACKPGKSENRRDPLTSWGLINAMMLDRTESWRHVYRPCSRATPQLDNTCNNVWVLPQKGHLSLTLLPHLTSYFLKILWLFL